MVTLDGAHPGANVDDDWLSLADAAAQLEISVDAMRRRMRASIKVCVTKCKVIAGGSATL